MPVPTRCGHCPFLCPPTRKGGPDGREQDGAQAQQQVEGQPEGGQPSQHGGQGQQPQQKPQAQLQVGAGDARPEDYEAQLRAKDAKIAELSAKVADAAKS